MNGDGIELWKAIAASFAAGAAVVGAGVTVYRLLKRQQVEKKPIKLHIFKRKITSDFYHDGGKDNWVAYAARAGILRTPLLYGIVLEFAIINRLDRPLHILEIRVHEPNLYPYSKAVEHAISGDGRKNLDKYYDHGHICLYNRVLDFVFWDYEQVFRRQPTIEKFSYASIPPRGLLDIAYIGYHTFWAERPLTTYPKYVHVRINTGDKEIVEEIPLNLVKYTGQSTSLEELQAYNVRVPRRPPEYRSEGGQQL